MRTRTLILTSFMLALAACTEKTTTGPDLDLQFAKGGSGGGGKPASTAIVPVQLIGKSLACATSDARAINNAQSPVIGGYCDASQRISPLIWSGGVASIIADTGMVNDVALDGTIGGDLDFKPFVRRPGGQPSILPMSDATWGSVSALSATGNVAVGDLQWSDHATPAIWTWNGSTWVLGNLPGFVSTISDNGDAVAGAASNHAARWRLSSGTWVSEALPDNGAVSSRVSAMNQDGTVLVGRRDVPLSSGEPGTYEQPVVWTNSGGTWTMTVLPGINILEGSANGVATRNDGSVIIAGYSWEDKAGAGEQQWAVVWIRAAGATQFAGPTRLDPLVKGQPAVAMDVNAFGQIVGGGPGRAGWTALMWTLQ